MATYVKNNGFTIVEIVLFLIITGVIGAIIGVRAVNYNKLIDLDRAARQVLSDVRYAQEMAMSSNRGVTFNISGNGYFLTWDDGSALASTFHGRSVQEDLSDARVTFAGSDFSFTSNGLPDSPVSLTVSNSAGSKSIRVNATTGFSRMN
ncbi:GspH/FimT family pseudopilin [bacterium]|nr:GspH/FimT family pseudopilin [bacterium]